MCLDINFKPWCLDPMIGPTQSQLQLQNHRWAKGDHCLAPPYIYMYNHMNTKITIWVQHILYVGIYAIPPWNITSIFVVIEIAEMVKAYILHWRRLGSVTESPCIKIYFANKHKKIVLFQYQYFFGFVLKQSKSLKQKHKYNNCNCFIFKLFECPTWDSGMV